MMRSNNENRRIVSGGLVARMFVLGAIMLGMSMVAGTAIGKMKQAKFTNNSSTKATDLHIEFQRGSMQVTGVFPVNSLPINDSDKKASTINLKAGDLGAGVNAGDSIIITFKYSGSDPKVKSAWWTSGNTLKPNGNHKKGQQGTGDYIPDGELTGTDVTLQWVGSQATGDGVYMVLIDAQPLEFDTLPGEPVDSVSARFSQFILDLEFGNVLAEDIGVVQCTGYSYFTDIPNLQVDVIQQDSTLEVFVDPCEMELDVTNLIAGDVAQFTVTDIHEGMIVAIVYSLTPGVTEVNGFAGYCGSLGLKGVTPNQLLGMGPIVGGQFTKFVPIPPQAQGLELITQAIMRDVCPTSCESNVDTQLIK